MKKWISAILCLSMVIGMGSVEVNATEDKKTDEKPIHIMNTVAAETDTASVETSTAEKPVQLPAYMGNVSVKEETVFTVAVNGADSTCVITGYTGNAAATTVYIPEKINGNTVTAVGDKVFDSCPYLKNVVVRGDVDFQGNSVFYSTARPELWGKSAGKTAAYAVSHGLVFHPMEGPATVSGKKNASLNKATLTWGVVNGAVSYNVYRKSGKEKYALCQNVAALAFTNDKLKAGTSYTYKVSPVFTAADGEVIEGYFSKETTVSMTPAKPKKVRAKGVRGGIQIRWARNKNVSGYQVYMKVHVKGFKTKFNKVKTIKKNKITGYRCKMLVRGMKYSYRVRTYKTVKGKKIFSPFVTVTTRAK